MSAPEIVSRWCQSVRATADRWALVLLAAALLALWLVVGLMLGVTQ